MTDKQRQPPSRRASAVATTTTYPRHPRTEPDQHEVNWRKAHERALAEFPAAIFELRRLRAIRSRGPEPLLHLSTETQYEIFCWLRDLDDREAEEMPVAIQLAFGFHEVFADDTLRLGVGQ